MSTPALAELSQRLESSTIRELLRDGLRPDMISLAAGLPDTSLLDIEGLASASHEVFQRFAHSALQYGVTEGQPRLQHALVALMASRGTTCSAEQLLITNGSQQGLDMLSRLLINAGDTVVVERPTYLAALQNFRLANAHIVGVNSDHDGLCIEELPRHGAKVLYIVPEFANPTGATLSLQRRYALLRWAAQHQVVIIEDDPYGELRYHGTRLPSLLTLSQEVQGAEHLVCHLSSLSKIVAPALRLGWLIAPSWLKPALVKLKQALDLQTGSLNQEIAACYLQSGRLAAHLQQTKAVYQQRRDALCLALQQQFGHALDFTVPDGGMFIWARFNPPVNTHELLTYAKQRGVIFVTGGVFYDQQPDNSTLRLGFASVPSTQLQEAVARLAQAWQDWQHAQS